MKKKDEKFVEEVVVEKADAEEMTVRKMSHFDVERALAVFTKVAIKKPFPRWEIAERKRVLSAIMKSINEAREAPKEVQDYHRERDKIRSKYGAQIGEGTGRWVVTMENKPLLEKELAALELEYQDVIEDERERIEDLVKLMKTEVEVDIEPVAYEWLGDEPDSNDVEVLMELGLVNRPVSGDDDDDEDEGEEIKRRCNARNKRKAKARKR